jgi:nicotinamide-nucleotide amidase
MARVQSMFEQQQDVRDGLAAQVADLARARELTVAVAESLTGGMVSTPLAAAEAASEWFRGSLVAYSSKVKHEVLDVPAGPVVSAAAASAMARGVRRLLRADVAVAVTGAGGPEGQDGQEPGTVFLAVDDGADQRVQRLDLDGDDPAAVCEAAAEAALKLLAEQLRGA